MRKQPATWIVVVILALIAALFVARAVRQPARLQCQAGLCYIYHMLRSVYLLLLCVACIAGPYVPLPA